MCNPVTTERPGSLLAKGVHVGLEWEVVKNDRGFRCGYVRIPPGHPPGTARSGPRSTSQVNASASPSRPQTRQARIGGR